MSKQQFDNHVRYYPPHHFVFYPVVLICISASVYEYFHHPEERKIWLAITAIFVMITWTAFMLRQHYALSNQNRIVRIELRFRYFLITGQRLEPVEAKLTFSQLAALRFASDEELAPLVQRALDENLSATDIKKSIHNWLPDYMRV